MPNIKQSKRNKKPGKTLLVKSIQDGFDLDNLEFDELKGLVSQNTSNSSNTKFLVFEKLEYASSAFYTLKANEQYKKGFAIKFPKYNLFFTINGLDSETNYDEVRKAHIQFITENTNARVLHYKLYRKNDKYLNCGEVVVDLKEAMDLLLNKDGELKNFSLCDEKLSGIFYRYNKKMVPVQRDQLLNA